ncbi:hypothetical protein BG006_007459 [Podila minutissima]|uniref:Uncharacterized protein n=1 Tax=Podila minutissima TaxID=64525 RepID=A0A9P5SJR1_9FUNG|nr:hypothetical protein BG006_007459 [Podila minutissima]
MTLPENQASPAGQSFKSQDDMLLVSLSTHLCAESDKRFVYWKDIEETFESVFYLQDRSDERLLFMIDDNAELHIPLRIEHDPDDDYTVVYINSQRPQSDIYQGNASIPTPIHLFDPLERLFTTTKYLFDRLKLTPNAARATFLQLVANARHYHALLVQEIRGLDEFGFRAQFPRTDRTSVLKRVQKLDEQVPEWDYRNICFNMFYGDHGKWDYATSKLFVVLPSDPDSLDDNNPSTHKFRLYFLCDNSMDALARRGMPQHVHLSNHPGYILKRPQEFFEKYGDYVLRLLQLVRLGYSDNAYDIPAIDTFNILWKFKAHAGINLDRDTIRSLVEKAISHIEKISPPKWIMEPGLTRIQSAAIKDFLDVQCGDNAEGNLHRHIDSRQCVSWRCHRHKDQYFAQKPLEAFKAHVGRRRGHIDMQQARLRVELQTHRESIEFQRLLTIIRQPFNLSIKLNWNATRSFVEKFCQDVAQLKTVAMDIDGITPSIYPQGFVHYTHNIFADKVLPETGLQLITLLNYPRPHEQCIHIGNFSLQSRLSPLRSSHSWVELRADLDRCSKLVFKAQVASECEAAAAELHLVQKKHELSDTTSITIHDDKWAAVFDLKELAVIEAYSQDAECPRAIRSSRSLRRLTVDLKDLEFDKQFFQIVNANTGLQYLNVAYHGKTVFAYIEYMIKSWRESPSPYCLTLIDRLEDTRGRIVAQMMVRRPDSGNFDVDSTLPSTRKGKHGGPPPDIRFVKWDEDQACTLVDYHAMFLDMATLQHPSTLRLLTVDTSRLSGDGLDSIRNVLRRSRLEHLNLVCKPVDPTLSHSISEALRAIPWGTLKSLVLSGNDTNGCMELCPTPEEPRLLHFQIYGTGSAPQELTHSSALLIHQLASESLLEKMVIKGVQLQDPSDWIVIVDAPDPTRLKKIELCENSMSQLRSNTVAAVLYDSKFKTRAGTNAWVPVTKVQSLQDVFARNEIPQRARDRVFQMPITTSRILDGIQTPVVTYEMAYDAETQTAVSMSEMPDDAGSQTSVATSEISDDAESQTSVATSEMSDDAETQSSVATSEMSDDAEIQTSVAPSDTTSDIEIQALSSSSGLVSDAETQVPRAVPQSAQEIVSQTSVTPLKMASDTATRMAAIASEISGDSEAQTAVAASETSNGSEPRMLSVIHPTNNDNATRDGLATSQNMAKTRKASRWRRICHWCRQYRCW